MSKDHQLERKTLDRMFGGFALTPPPIWYIELTTTVPTDAVNGFAVAYTGYGRIAIPNDSTHWGGAVTGNSVFGTNITTKVNALEVVFATATGVSSPITIAGYEMWDAATGGTRWYWGVASATGQIVNGKRPRILPGTIAFIED